MAVKKDYLIELIHEKLIKTLKTTDGSTCIYCGKTLLETDPKYNVIIVENYEKKIIGFQCQNCYFKSIPDEVWEDLDKYHQGI